MLYKPTHPKLLPDHIEISPNIAPTRPSFNDLVSFEALSTASGETLEWREMLIIKYGHRVGTFITIL